MSATSVLRFVNNKKFLFAAIVVFFIPFILFCFWNVPSADDYMILDKKQQYSFWGLQDWVYQTWSGRYFSTFVSTFFSYSGFLYSHYYLHTILLLSCTFFSWGFLLKQVNKYLLSNHLSLTSLVLVSFLLLIVQIQVIPEPVTAFYWFSSAITYQVPLILMILLAAVICKLFNDPLHKKINVIVATLLIVCLNGCNETITLFVLVISTLLLAYYFSKFKKLPPIVVGLYSFSVISSCFLLFAPGILYRGSLINASPVLSIVSIACIKLIVLNWFFLKEPLWWFCLLFLTSFFSNNPQLSAKLFSRFQNVSPISFLAVYIFTGLLVYIPILYVSNGSLPLRTENIICFLYSLGLLLILSIIILNQGESTAFISAFYPYRYLLFSVLIFSSANMKRVSDTLLSGFFYKQVMQERLNIFEDAKRTNLHEINFDDYQLAVSKRLKEYSFLDRRVLKDVVLKPPPIICFESDVYDINYMKEFYGIKKLTINK